MRLRLRYAAWYSGELIPWTSKGSSPIALIAFANQGSIKSLGLPSRSPFSNQYGRCYGEDAWPRRALGPVAKMGPLWPIISCWIIEQLDYPK